MAGTLWIDWGLTSGPEEWTSWGLATQVRRSVVVASVLTDMRLAHGAARVQSVASTPRIAGPLSDSAMLSATAIVQIVEAESC